MNFDNWKEEKFKIYWQHTRRDKGTPLKLKTDIRKGDEVVNRVETIEGMNDDVTYAEYLFVTTMDDKKVALEDIEIMKITEAEKRAEELSYQNASKLAEEQIPNYEGEE